MKRDKTLVLVSHDFMEGGLSYVLHIYHLKPWIFSQLFLNLFDINLLILGALSGACGAMFMQLFRRALLGR